MAVMKPTVRGSSPETAAAHPAFTIIYASGYLKARDFVRSGWRMTLASILLLMAAATFYWPLIK
jgi:solute carrier family 13 (sodium-dependent dicarboxylate transporter), member 2/3/5